MTLAGWPRQELDSGHDVKNCRLSGGGDAMKCQVLVTVVLCGAALAVSPGMSVWAADAAPDESAQPLEEVIVTAQKRAENIQNVPLSIISVSGDALRAAGINSPLDLGRVVPALRIYTGSIYTSGITIRIRGFGSGQGNTATDADVASYLDGAFIPRPGAILSSFLDVSNVEVLSGPQGTLFGRNAAMGALSIHTNAPSLDGDSLEGSLEGGSYGTYVVTGIANAPVNDQFAVRVAVKANHSDGLFENDLDDRTYGQTNGLVGRLSAKWDIAPGVNWVMRFDGSENRGDGVTEEAVDTASASPAQLASLSAFVARYGGTPPVYSNPPSLRFNQYEGSPFIHDHQIGITSDIDWNLSSLLTLRLLDSYRDWHDTQLAGDAVATALSLTRSQLMTSSISQSHELQLISSKDAYLGGRLGFTSGLYFFHEDFGLNTNLNDTPLFCVVLYGARAPALVPVCQAGQQVNAGYDNLAQSSTSYAGYGQINYQILPTLELDLGARISSDKKSAVLDQVANNRVGVAPLLVPENDNLTTDLTRPSEHVSLSWHITDMVMPFVTYSTGYKSGGFNAGASAAILGPAQRTFSAETVNDYEAGVKSILLNGKLLLNATAFDTELHNFQDRSFNGTSFLVRNAGNVRSRGVDLNGQFRVLSDLDFTYGNTYEDSIYTKDISAPGLEGCTGLPGCPTVQNLSGQPVGYSPRWNGYLGLNWKIGEFGGFATSFNANENFTTSFLTANTDNPQSRVPGYETTDLRLSVGSPSGRWRVDLFGSNVFDRRYYVYTLAQPLAAVMGINNPNTGATVFRGFLGDPARYGVRLSGKF
jgi:iron complex outermembrane recepter protein